MPRLQDIEELKNDLAALGHEAETLERWGEAPRDIPPPEGAADAPMRPAEPPEEGIPPDFASLLEGLPLESDGGGGPSEDEQIAALLGSLDTAVPSAAEPQEPPVDEHLDFDFDLASFAEAPPELDLSNLDFSDLSPAASAQEAPLEAEPLEALESFEEPVADEEPVAEAPEAIEAAIGDIEDFSFDLGAETFNVEVPSIPESEKPSSATSKAHEFESFNIEEPGGAGFGGPRREPAEAESMLEPASEVLDLDTEIASLSEEAPAAATFNLDSGWGGFGDFGASGTGVESPTRGAKPARKVAPQESARIVSLSEAQVDILQDSLLSFPLNLRVAVEDILANAKGTDIQQSRLVWMLVEGATASDAALLCGRILKRTIEIPKGYRKRTGAAFEAKKGSLGYILVHTVLPILRIGALALAAAAALAYLGWRFVYTPLAANSLYRSGYALIAEDRFPEAELAFADATEMREFIRWYYLYAEAYAAKRQYILAENKYSSLLERYPGEKRGALAWARLEREQLKYESAIGVLRKRILETDYFNQDALLLSGDVYLDWAEEDKRMYEEARRCFAGLIERYGAKDAYLERMLLYFMRTDDRQEALALKRRFLADSDGSSSSRASIPLSAPTLAELGGYILDIGEIEDAYRVLVAAAAKDPAVPETYFHLARYFRRSGSPAEERGALDRAAAAFEALPGLSGKKAGMYIEGVVRRGRLLLAGREWLGAEQDFSTAASAYEDALELRRVKRSSRFSEAYAGLAEVAFWQRDDLEGALELYARAASDGYETSLTLYRQGYILYRLGRAKDALERFYGAAKDGSESPYLEYAFGAALYARGDWFSAEAFFRRVKERMLKELSELDLPSPQERASEAEIVELLMKAENNLGAALYRVAARVGDSRIRARAMAAFAESSRYFDSLTRDPATLTRPDTRNLGFLNMDFVLHPLRDFDISIYPEIERDPAFPKKG
jgi:tetratricopeptide (TPR) repeat protein